jgi:hypothetical protein
LTEGVIGDSYHSSDFVHALQIFYNFGFVSGFDAREETTLGAGCALFGYGQFVKFPARITHSGGVFFFGENANTTANGFSSSLNKQNLIYSEELM